MELRGGSSEPLHVNVYSYIVMVLVMVCIKFSRIRLCFMDILINNFKLGYLILETDYLFPF